MQAHRLVLLAQREGGAALGDRAKAVLFRLAYEDSKNISDMATLINAAKELGLDEGGAASAYFQSDDGRAEVRELMPVKAVSTTGCSIVSWCLRLPLVDLWITAAYPGWWLCCR